MKFRGGEFPTGTKGNFQPELTQGRHRPPIFLSLSIIHSGRTDPKGRIALASNVEKLSLRNGDALLLRVN